MSASVTGDYFDELIEKAMAAGQTLDLTDCVYGQAGQLPTYYTFLAGFCRHTRSERILEIGTFRGGSTHAMHKGLSGEPALRPNIVTVDIEERPTPQIDDLTGVRRVIGDALALPKLKEIQKTFGEAPIDLLFLDSTKVGRIVLAQFATLVAFLGPKYVIMDDITLNDSMISMWGLIQKKYGERAINVGLAYPGIRKMAELNPKVTRHPGFGLVQVR